VEAEEHKLDKKEEEGKGWRAQETENEEEERRSIVRIGVWPMLCATTALTWWRRRQSCSLGRSSGPGTSTIAMSS